MLNIDLCLVERVPYTQENNKQQINCKLWQKKNTFYRGMLFFQLWLMVSCFLTFHWIDFSLYFLVVSVWKLPYHLVSSCPGRHASAPGPLMSEETNTYGFRRKKTCADIRPWHQNDTAVMLLKFLIWIALINTHWTFWLWGRWFSTLLFFTVDIRNRTAL